mgnify:CR=1 FL=1
MKKRKYRYFVGDFETTVYKGQVNTEVWASAMVELYTEDVKIFHSIGDTFEYLISLKENIICYYHNLKFDGSFWLSFLLVDLGFKQAFTTFNEEGTQGEWLKERDMANNSFKYSISNKGMWYNLIIKVGGHFIELRDSLKLLPFSVEKIGESFNTKHKKLEMEYTGLRYAGCDITPEEQKYIKNDVLVVKEALEIMFNDGHNSLTIGSCCLEEYKKIMADDYDMFFPDMYSIPLDKNIYDEPNAGEWLRHSYKGGWCYLVKGKENKIYTKGTTADVNSLYPSMMSSESGNRYPVGKPYFWSGNFIPDKALQDNTYYFVRIKTRFHIKKNMLPFIQIKGSFLYRGTEALETSDYFDPKTEKYSRYYKDFSGIHDTNVILTLTMTDFQLMKEHYEMVDFEILDGCWFYTQIGLFDGYMNKYKKIKMENKGAIRELAKLFLNNLYGKLASSTDSSFKLAYVKEDKSIGFIAVEEHNKKAGYIPCGSAITSYARNFTIRAAQKNYYGVNNSGFIYADTDSIHCDLAPEKITGIDVDDNNFCCWKLESCWDEAIFTRQKTYIEHVTHENLIPVEEIIEDGEPKKPYYNIKCAGMPKKCKKLFEKSMHDIDINKLQDYTQEEVDFLKTKRTLKDFKIGLKVPGKLMPKRIRGGTLLVDTTYEMR